VELFSLRAVYKKTQDKKICETAVLAAASIKMTAFWDIARAVSWSYTDALKAHTASMNNK
jgi:hypothetical protein